MRALEKLSWTIFTLMLLLSFTHIVFAQSNSDGVILRPVVEYTSEDLRDPFSNLFQLNKEKKDQNIQVPQESIEQEQPLPDLGNFKVQGIIWGGNFPQAVINNKILKVGDLIDGGQIASIEKKGITLNYAGRMVNLEMGNKEDK